MKRYKKQFNEQDEKTDDKIVDKIFEFIQKNPYPKDSQIHKLAEDSNMEPDKLEEAVYAILSVIIAGGKSYKKNKTISDFDKNEVDMGVTVEQEHLAEDSNDPIIKRAVELFKQKISADHLTENDKYYSEGKANNFFDELK